MHRSPLVNLNLKFEIPALVTPPASRGNLSLGVVFSRGERARNSSAHSGMACGIMIFAIFALLVATVVTCVSGTRLLQQGFPVSRLGPRLGSAARARRPPSARFNCNGGLARDARNDFIVSLKGGYDLDLVIDSLERVPENLQAFHQLDMFSATLSQGDVLALLRNEAVDYVECDAKVSVGAGR